VRRGSQRQALTSLLRYVRDRKIELLESSGEAELVDRAKDAGRYAHTNGLAQLWNEQSLRLKVRLELVVGLVVSVANTVTVLMGYTRDITTTCHSTSRKVKNSRKPYISLGKLSKLRRWIVKGVLTR
jgi:hypothetical protein